MGRFIPFLLITISLFIGLARGQDEFDPDSIISLCRGVVANHLDHEMSNGWQVGTYMTGVMALYYLTEDQQYLDSTIAWGNYHNWMPNGEVLTSNYDNVCCLQTYYEIFMQDPTTENESRIENAMTNTAYYTYDEPIGESWPIIDMAFMSAPNMSRYFAITGDTSMVDSLYTFSLRNVQRHYNPYDSLWRSNVGWDAGEEDLEYWGRGCGWAVGYLCRALDYIPEDSPYRLWFYQRIREVLKSLIKYQQEDGCWRSDLTHPDVIPMKETSSTAFFTFGYLYALNRGIIDRETFWPVVQNAWSGLVGCIREDGRVGYSQGVGGGPSDFTEDNSNDYTDGAFLLAGYELYKYITGKDRSPGLVIDPLVINFASAQERVASCPSQVISVTNRAPDIEALQNINVSSDAGWLDVSFSDNEGDEQEAIVSLTSDAEALGLGEFSGKLIFTGDNVDTMRITVNLTISEHGPNIALNKPAESSSVTSGNLPANAVDGDPDTRWESEFADDQWISIDLEAVYSIERMVIQWQNAASDVYALQISDDGSTWTTIDSVADGSSGETRELSPEGEGRYLRLYCYTRTTGYGNSIYEWEVYGAPQEVDVKDVRSKMAKNLDIKIKGSDLFLSLFRSERVSVELFTLSGRKVASLVNRKLQKGFHSISLKLDRFAKGSYLLRVNRDETTDFRSVVNYE